MPDLAEFFAKNPPDDTSTIAAVSGVNQRGNGFVHIAMETGKGITRTRGVMQCTAAEARQIAQQIAEAAEAAETDAFLFQFLQSKVQLDPARAAMVLNDFRIWRETSGGVKANQPEQEHWQDMKKNEEAQS
jgi:hypothetical protein